MGLREQIAALAIGRAHVLIIEVPGERLLRLRTEVLVANAGWIVATSPADADVLLVCGHADGQIVARVDRLWDQMVAPRVRVPVGSSAEIPWSIRTARLALLDEAAQRIDAEARVLALRSSQQDPPEHSSTPHGGTVPPPGSDGSITTGPDPLPPDTEPDSTPAAQQSPQHAAMDMGHVHGMDMNMDMDMSGPAGIPLAQGEDDRDGLEMDALHVSLGPVLLAWPADLVLRCTLHGDVIARADAELVPLAVPPAAVSSEERSALLVDAAARVMLLAGWEAVATALRRVRDELLSSSPDRSSAARRLGRVSRRIRRSRTVRWSLRGVRASATPGRADDVDVHELLLDLLAHASITSYSSGPNDLGELRAVSGSDLASAVEGHDLATARLIVAALTPWGSVGGPPPGVAIGGSGG